MNLKEKERYVEEIPLEITGLIALWAVYRRGGDREPAKGAFKCGVA